MLGTSQMRSDSSPTPQVAMPACARLALDCSRQHTSVGSTGVIDHLCRTSRKCWPPCRGLKQVHPASPPQSLGMLAPFRSQHILLEARQQRARMHALLQLPL